MDMNLNDSVGSITLFVHQVGITREHLDELGHANYNKLKDIFESARHRLFKYLGFGRKTLRQKLGVGFVMKEDSYIYHKPLVEGDVIFFIAKIEVVGPARLIVKLRVCRLLMIKDPTQFIDLTNEATYQMVLINLKTGKVLRIPKQIQKQIKDYTEVMTRLSTHWC